MWYQFFFNQNNFIILYSIKHIHMISKYIFIQSKQIYIQNEIFLLKSIKIFFYYMNFSFDTFLVTIFGLSFFLLLQKSEFYFQCINWTAARCCKKAAKKDTEYQKVVQGKLSKHTDGDKKCKEEEMPFHFL